MTPCQLSDVVVGAVRDLVEAGALRLPDGVPDRVVVETPRVRSHGDYASTVAMQLAGPAGLPPRELAGLLAARLEGASGIEAVEVAGPGFVNVRLAAGVPGEVAARVVAAGPSYGRSGTDTGALVHLVPRSRPELEERIGVDAARYALARCPAGSRIDIQLWSRASSDNPVYFVQHAHALTSSILRSAAALGVVRADHPALLTHDHEGHLLLALAAFPRAVAAAATLDEPHRVARHVEDTASAFHRFHEVCRVLPVGDEEPGPNHSARLLLVEATRVVLSNGLGLLGVSAPDRM